MNGMGIWEIIMRGLLHNLKSHFNNSNLECKILVVSMFSGMAICFTSAIVNYFLAMGIWASIVPFIMSIFYVFFIYDVVVRNNFKLAAYGSLAMITVFVFPSLWLTGGGLKGSIPYFYIYMIFLSAVVLNKHPFKRMIAFQIVTLLGLIYIDVNQPELIKPYDSHMAQIFDMSYSLIVIITLVFFLIRYIMMKYNQTIDELRNTKAELEKANEILHHSSITDPLTDLYNRRYIKEKLENMSSYDCSSSSAVIMIDIDYFKFINDNFGHDVGDCVLKNIGELFKDNLPSNSHVSRIGGEEFLIVLENTSQDKAFEVGENLRQLVENNTWDKHDLKVTISAGVYSFDNSISVENIFKRADDALYMSKNGGRNRVMCFDS
jgi:diguanylate cyclase (GGDEF)-like protein